MVDAETTLRVETSMERADSGGVGEPTVKSNPRQRKTPKSLSPSSSKPILQRLEGSKPAHLDMGHVSPGGPSGSGFEPSPERLDSSKPPPSAYAAAAYAYDQTAEGGDTDLAVAAFVAAALLALVASFLDMNSTIVRVVRLLLPLQMQAQALSWVRSANLEVAMWASCSVVEACLVWSVFAALYGVTGALAGLLPGTSAGFTVAVTRFGRHSWAKGTVLRRVSPAAAAAATLAVTLVSLAFAYQLDARLRRRPQRAGEGGAYRPGWYSPGALMSLRISPITRVSKASPTAQS